MGLPEQTLKDPVRLLGDAKARDHMSDRRTKSQTSIKALHSARAPLTLRFGLAKGSLGWEQYNSTREDQEPPAGTVTPSLSFSEGRYLHLPPASISMPWQLCPNSTHTGPRQWPLLQTAQDTLVCHLWSLLVHGHPPAYSNVHRHAHTSPCALHVPCPCSSRTVSDNS